MVADGEVDFGHQSFGLSELLKALGRGATPEGGLAITTAYRGEKVDGRVADDFKFEFKAGSLADYDQVWLFGYQRQGSGHDLSQEELKVLSAFMNGGGGVFATGDHEDLGYALCGQVPRVRSMRRWCRAGVTGCEDPAPSRNEKDRLDTLREGHDFGFQVSDQSDDIPQTILPKLNKSDCYFIPHPLLSHGNATIRVLPDHMHEGDCVAPTDLTKKLKFADGPEFDEYPLLSNQEVRLSPEVIAVAVSAGGHLQDRAEGEDRPPVDPRCFGAICVYDGHRVRLDGHRVGRVVVDASFHHFVNINLDGTGALKGRGLHDDEGRPTEDYEAIKRYYRNIAGWLIRPASKLLRYVKILISLRYMFPLVEEIRPDEEWTLDNLFEVGELTRRALSDFLSPAAANECTLSILAALGGGDLLKELADPQAATPRTAVLRRLLKPQLVVDAVLGVSMLLIARHLPGDAYEAGKRLEKMEERDDALAAMLTDDAGRLAAALGQAVERLSESLGEASKVLVTLDQPETEQPGDA